MHAAISEQPTTESSPVRTDTDRGEAGSQETNADSAFIQTFNRTLHQAQLEAIKTLHQLLAELAKSPPAAATDPSPQALRQTRLQAQHRSLCLRAATTLLRVRPLKDPSTKSAASPPSPAQRVRVAEARRGRVRVPLVSSPRPTDPSDPDPISPAERTHRTNQRNAIAKILADISEPPTPEDDDEDHDDSTPDITREEAIALLEAQAISLSQSAPAIAPTTPPQRKSA